MPKLNLNSPDKEAIKDKDSNERKVQKEEEAREPSVIQKNEIEFITETLR